MSNHVELVGSRPGWVMEYNGPTWYFGWVRKSNLYMDRMNTWTKGAIPDAAFDHWMGIARFFRGLEYARLVSTFGDVPYFDKVIDASETDLMYKDRTPRGEVMDKVYDDFKFAFENVKLDDGNQNVNKYVVAGFISRWMLFEGTWQYYHNLDKTKAQKYLTFAKEASEFIMNSGKFDVTSNFRALFGSYDLTANKEVIFSRHYSAAQGITHCIASYSSGYEVQTATANLDLLKAFICNDGNVWQESTTPNASSFSIKDLSLTRDPRLESTFLDRPSEKAPTLVMCQKFVDRIGPTYLDSNVPYPPQYNGQTNENDYPVLRLAEILLNWVEAKAVLAEMGSESVTQIDIDASINKIRNRPLDAVATAKGVKKTAPMSLAALPTDPDRDASVPALIWEIRRERRMEFVHEYSRLNDLRRWKKLEYMSGTNNPDLLKGAWVNFPAEYSSFMTDAKIGKLKIHKADDTIVTYDGTNAADMVGFYRVSNAVDRDPFGDKVYLSPVGKAQVEEYAARGYKLTQTTGW